MPDQHRPDRPQPDQRLLDWFVRPGVGEPGLMNFAYNALDRHVIRGLAEQTALLHPFAAAGNRTHYTYAELLERVGQLGGGLRELGVRPGRSVVLALPIGPELVIGLLACARVGAVAVPVVDDAPEAVGRLGTDPALDRPAVVVVDAPRKAAVDAVLTEVGRNADYQVVFRPGTVVLDPTVGDIDFAVVMRPGAFQPAVCAELPPESPLLLRSEADGTTAYDQGWALDLVADARATGLAPGSFVTPADDTTAAAPYAALLGPFLVGATVELR